MEKMMSAKIAEVNRARFQAADEAMKAFQAFREHAQKIQVIDNELHMWMELVPSGLDCWSCSLPAWFKDKISIYSLAGLVEMAIGFLGYGKVIIHVDSSLGSHTESWGRGSWACARPHGHTIRDMNRCIVTPKIAGLVWEFPPVIKPRPEPKKEEK